MRRRPSVWRNVAVWVGVAGVLIATAWVVSPGVVVQWRLHMARRALAVRDLAEALDFLRASLRSDPQRVETYYLLARTHRRRADVVRAAVYLKQYADRGGDPALAERESILALAQSGRLREAEPYLGQLLIDAQGDGPDICEAFVQGYFLNLRIDAALEMLTAWQQDYPADPQPHFMQGFLYQALELWPEAVEAYRQGLLRAPKRADMRARLGEALIKQGQWDEADEELGRAAAEAPDQPDIFVALARCRFQRADTAEARELVHRALVQLPEHFEARRLVAEIELAEGHFAEAAAVLEELFRQRPYDPTIRHALGRALRALGRAAEAKPHFDYLAEAEPALHRLEQHIRQVLTEPQNAELRFQIGRTLLRYGSPEDGARWLRTVLEIDPKHEGARQLLSAYEAAQRPAGAAGPPPATPSSLPALP